MSNPTTLETSPSKKRGGPARLLRSALLAFGCRSHGKPSSTVDWGCGLGLWNVVSSVRPLHHPSEPPESVIDIEGHHDGAEEEEEEEETCTVSDVMSSYGSAQDLSKLDCSEEEVEVEEEEKSIDQRAEEFIAHFYEQMRLQQLELESVVEAY